MKSKGNRILFVGLNRAPPHCEAWSKSMDDWSALLKGVVLTTGKVRPIMKKQKNYIVINSKIGYFLLPLYSVVLQHFFDLIIIEQRPDIDLHGILISFLIHSKILKGDKCCYRFTIEWMKDRFRNELGMRIFLKHVLPNLKFVFAFDKRTEHYLCKIADKKKVHFITGLNLAEYQEFPIHPNSDFQIMFASSPLHSDYEGFKEKGVDIILDALKDVISSPHEKNFRLVVLWRSSSKYLKLWLSKLNLENYVDLHLGYVDIDKLLRNSHITVFTPRSLAETAHYPRSIIESLAVGRPVIVTDNLEISKIIEKEKCGIVIKPSPHDLAKAIRQISIDYEKYQRNCRKTAEEFFDLEKNLFKCLPENV